MKNGQNFSLSKVLLEASIHRHIGGQCVTEMLAWLRCHNAAEKGYAEAENLLDVILLMATPHAGGAILAEGHIDRFCKHVVYMGKQRGAQTAEESDLMERLMDPTRPFLSGAQVGAIREAALSAEVPSE